MYGDFAFKYGGISLLYGGFVSKYGAPVNAVLTRLTGSVLKPKTTRSVLS